MEETTQIPPQISVQSFAGQTALITGAGQGLGAATCLMMAERGARLIIVDIDSSALTAVRKKLDALDCTYFAQTCDATDQTSVEAMVRAAEREGFVPDVLVNNVGGGIPGRIWDLTVDQWDQTMQLSLRSMFLCSRAILPGMIERGYGRVICLSSTSRKGSPWMAQVAGGAAYATAKAGVEGFVKSLSLELADSGVTINAVAPGPIDTESAGPYLRNLEEQNLPFSPFRLVPMRRLGTPREAASAIVFLASQDASYITGTTLEVDGGF